MDADIEHAREEIRATQQHIGRTIAEIESRITETTAEVKRQANPLTYAREYPWIALGLAVGAGLALALTGADRAAGHAVVSMTRNAGNASADGASAVTAKVSDLVHRDGGEPSDQAEAGAHVPNATSERNDASGGLARKPIFRDITGLLNEGLDEVLIGLGRQRPSAERRLAGR